MGSGTARPASRFHMTAQEVINECAEGNRMRNLHILVTGATSGIGIETGRVLACNGAKVYMMGRDEKKVQEVVNNLQDELQRRQQPSGGSVQGVICDLNSLASIKQFAQRFLRDHAVLNGLILNAGIFNSSYQRTVDGLEQVMGVNHMGHAYLTQLLMPILLASAPSRIVILSSSVHAGPPLNYQAIDRMNSTAKNAQKEWGILSSYQQSKLANLLFARALASRYKDQRITAYSVHPGAIRTNLGSNIPFSGLMMVFFKQKTVAQGAATTVYCVVSPGLENQTGRYFDNSAVTNLAEKWKDHDADQLWEWTERVLRERTAAL